MLRLQYILKFRKSLDTFRQMMLDRQCKDPILSDEDRYKEWVDQMVKQILEKDTGFFHLVMKDYRGGEKDAHIMVCAVRKAKLALLRQEMK